MAKCDCYYQHGSKFLCYGTKEMEECSCGGDESKCNFYPEKRKQKMANEKRLIYMDDTMDRLRAYADRKHQAGHTELANGVTIQKWIPVTERLPEKEGTYIVRTTTGAVTTARFYEERDMTNYRGDFIKHVEAKFHRNATHWMPLPEPPAIDK